MKTRNVYIVLTFIALCVGCNSCNNIPNEQLPPPQFDTVWTGDVWELIEKKIYVYTCEAGYTRAFFDVYWHRIGGDCDDEIRHNFGVRDSDDLSTSTIIPLLYPRYENHPDFFEFIGGCPNQFHYLPSQDKKSLYLVTRVQANSNGWTSEYQLFKVDCETLEARFICDCAAIKATDKGFTVAQCRLTNRETATCTADEDWVMHDEYLDWDGNIVQVKEKEYGIRMMSIKYYSAPNTYVKGFYGPIH